MGGQGETLVRGESRLRSGRRSIVSCMATVAFVTAGLVAGTPSAAFAVAPGTITTLAGTIVPGPSPATGVALAPVGVAAAGGSLFVADDAANVVRRVDGTGSQTVIAGNGSLGFSGDGGPAVSAQLDQPYSVAIDSSGNVAVADAGNDRIRMVAGTNGTYYGIAMTAGDIYTVAGNGTIGFSGDGGPATSAKFYLQSGINVAEGVVVDHAGNLVFADGGNSRIRVVAAGTGTFYGIAMTTGNIYTVAGGGTGGLGDGGPATAAQLADPSGITVDASGNIVVSVYNERIRVVAASTGTFYGIAMTAGDIYTVAGNGANGFSGDGGLAVAAELSSPVGVAVDGSGNLLAADLYNSRVRVVAASTGTFYGVPMTVGHIYTVVGSGTTGYSGDGGPATSASLYQPVSVAVDAAGNLAIADSANRRVRVTATSSGMFYGITMTAGDIYTVAGNGMAGFSGDGGPAAAAQLGAPRGVTVDRAGNVVVSDTSNRVRVIASSTGTFYGVAMTAGDIYTVAGNGSADYSADIGDAGPATEAEVVDPADVAVDDAGNLVVAEAGESRIRVVAASTGTFYGTPMTVGDIYTVAGTGTVFGGGYSGDGGPATSAAINQPQGVVVDGSGNLVIGDLVSNRVRVVAAGTGTFYGIAMTAGDIYTVAGTGTSGFSGDAGPATAAKISRPWGVDVDGSGNLVFSDEANARVRVVAAGTGTFYGVAMSAGDIYTVAGTGAFGFSGDGGPATSATFAEATGVAVDVSGNVAVADGASNRIRVIATTTASSYGIAMTAGDIYTVAGNGTSGNTGDGGSAAAAELNRPWGIAAGGSGKLVVADLLNSRVRVITGNTVPDAPTIGTVSLTGRTASVPFTTPADGGSSITSYTATCTSSDGGTTRSSGGAHSPIAVTLLSAGKAYTCTATATNAVGNSPASAESNSVSVANVPGAPTAVIARSASTTTGTGGVNISYTASVGNGGSAIVNYTATCRSTSAGAATPLTKTASTNPLVVTGLTTAKTYTCTVTAANAVGSSVASAPSGAVIVGSPAPPTNVVAKSGSTTTATGSLTVTFALGANNGSAITSQTVSCSATGGVTKSATHSGATATPVVVGGLTTGKNYTCTVKATNARGAGLASTPSGAVIVGSPAPPTNVVAKSGSTTTATGSLTVTFALGANNGSAITSQTVSCSATGGVTKSATHSGATATPVVVGGLTTGKNYTCTVKATNAPGAGLASTPSGAVIVGSPAPPTNVVATKTASGTLRVTFVIGANNGSAILSQTATCASSGGVTKSATHAGAAAAPITVSGLTGGATYTCKVTATNARGAGLASTASASTTA